jgi:exonuclease III
VKSILRTRKLEFPWPAAVQVCDIVKGDEVWGTVAGLYAVTKNKRGEKTGSGAYSFPENLSRLNPLMSSSRGERMIVAGDFNLWPGQVKPEIRGSGLVDLVEATAGTREPLTNCHDCKFFENTRHASKVCGHLWTHRNGARPKPNGKPFGGMIQQIDFVLASEQLATSVTRVDGGGQKFPDIWHISDHAPVIVDFAD